MKSLRKTAALAGILLICGAYSIFLAVPATGQTPPVQNPAPGPDGAVTGKSTDEAGRQEGKPGATPTAQTPAQPPPKNGRQSAIVVSTAIVTVPVTVKNRQGQLVPDLHRDEFRIFEDNVEQKITTFSAEAFPLSMVVLIDNDLKRKDAEQVAASLRAVLTGMSVADEASVCRFDQFFHEGHGFTANQDKLLVELKREAVSDDRPDVAPPSGSFGSPSINGQAAPGVNQGDAYPSTTVIGSQHTKAIDDAIYSAAKLLEDRGRDRRKIILLISDGQNGAKFNTNPYANVVKELLRNNISVFSVAVSSAFFDRKFSRLVDYAHATGGDIYYALKRGTMEELYSRVTEEARHQYTLYYSPTGTDRGADYHTIEVRVEREGLNVTAREGYYTSGLQK
ncbi:MAG TPA: VWA domain-containing protein [Candidatus Acidoferrum sp.]|nr:VWA domain-containing protein [Candidatus Acidoferrum sp.]